MVSVEIATNLNDVVQFLGSFRQSIVSTHDLAEFPSVKALVTSEETSGFTTVSYTHLRAHETV